MTDRSCPCLVCGKYLRSGTGRHQEGRSLYARLDGLTVRVGAACDSHFEGERRAYNEHYEGTHYPSRSRVGSVYLEWKDARKVRLGRGTEKERAPKIAAALGEAVDGRHPFGRDRWRSDALEALGRSSVPRSPGSDGRTTGERARRGHG